MAPLLWGYQNTLPALKTPTALGEDEAEFNLAHRFYGAVDKDPLETFLGMNAGANVGLSYRQHLIYNIELGMGYERKNNRYEFGSSFKFTPFELPVQAQIELAYFSFKQNGQDDRRKNFCYLLSAQNKPLWDRLSFTVNAGFDGYYERLVSGIGTHIILSDKIALIGEYYPVWDRDSAPKRIKNLLSDNDAYVFGIKMDTYGHHFIFLLSNAEGTNPQSLSMGTSSQDLRFGFNIQRRMQF